MATAVKRHRWRAAVPMAAWLCTGIALAEQAPPRFRSGVDLVALNVSVVDARHQFVTGLGAEDFAVYENGVRREVTFFGPASLPVDAALLLDVSGSMGPQMDLVTRAALGFIRMLRKQDRAAVIGFAERITMIQPLTNDVDELRAAVGRLRPRGRTALFDALYVIADEFIRERRDRQAIRRQALIVLTDGSDTASLASRQDAFTAIQRTGISVYVVSPQRPFVSLDPRLDDGERTEAAFLLTTLARDSGGRAFFLPNLTTLKDVYAEIAADLQHQYTLAFAPDERRRGTTIRQLLVRVVSRPEATVRTRRHYRTAAP